ncbi:DUF6894 family protein [Aurantiacibacter hainanensis]|uniref:DUF6894 family protein n=1 Tax=Aurantiacibacter hainanensis TaxID=3076114 RepID=UPI0030C74E22
MALYFFHFFDGESLELDEIGLDLSSAEAAYVEATKGARAMWAELLAQRRDPLLCRFSIEDECGIELFELPFSELLDDCRRTDKRPLRSHEELSRELGDSHRRTNVERQGIKQRVYEARQSLDESSRLLAELSEMPPFPVRK